MNLELLLLAAGTFHVLVDFCVGRDGRMGLAFYMGSWQNQSIGRLAVINILRYVSDDMLIEGKRVVKEVEEVDHWRG